MTDSFAELRAAAIDGRTHNIYYRQHQLEALHKALLDHATEIKEAIAADYDHSPAEVAVEIHLALSALKQSYETLQPTKAHAEEYLLASGRDAPASRIPAGIAYIEPCTHTLFFSVIAPLGTAIAAGNCAIVLVSVDLCVHEKARIANIFLHSLRTTSDLSIASCARY
jgi:acyl-CoA reductase-like NAD-dependent aldehyde dehydrogenase